MLRDGADRDGHPRELAGRGGSVAQDHRGLVEEAVALANDVRYGLAASVFSENVGRALKVAGRLDFGTVWVNEHLFPLSSEMPHGGYKQSGYGKDLSVYSLEDYTNIKHVMAKID